MNQLEKRCRWYKWMEKEMTKGFVLLSFFSLLRKCSIFTARMGRGTIRMGGSIRINMAVSRREIQEQSWAIYEAKT